MSKKIKILHTEWSDGWGGQEIRIINEMVAVREQGVEVFLACRDHAVIKQKALDNNIPVFVLPFRGNADFRTLFALKKFIRKYAIDIVNTHSGKDTWVGGLAAKLAGAKFIRTRHLSNRIRSSRTNFINELADHIFTTGEKVRSDMIKYNRIDHCRITSVPTGINAEIFDPNKYDVIKSRQDLGINPGEIAIGMTAVLRQFKRHDLLLSAVKRVVTLHPEKNIKVFLAGEGPMRKDIERHVQSLGLSNNVVLLGHISDIATFLSALDIFTLTSDSKEGVPQSVTQALMMGKVVLSTDVGSTRDLYCDNFVLVEPEVKSISEGLDKIILDHSMVERLSKYARSSVVHDYSEERMVSKIMEIYNEVLKDV